eukprot:1692919-Rhodomonas_salina.1
MQNSTMAQCERCLCWKRVVSDQAGVPQLFTCQIIDKECHHDDFEEESEYPAIDKQIPVKDCEDMKKRIPFLLERIGAKGMKQNELETEKMIIKKAENLKDLTLHMKGFPGR